MWTPKEVYIEFRKAQSRYNNKGFRLPKDWDKFFNEKLSKIQQEILIKMSNYLNTKWCDISISKYFDCGFELYKTFSYKNFFDRKVIKMYINKDKNEKRIYGNINKSLKDSMKYYNMNYENITEVNTKKCDNGYRQIIKDYLDNKVSGIFIIWLIKRNFLKLTDEEKSLCPYITEQFHTISNLFRGE